MRLSQGPVEHCTSPEPKLDFPGLGINTGKTHILQKVEPSLFADVEKSDDKSLESPSSELASLTGLSSISNSLKPVSLHTIPQTGSLKDEPMQSWSDGSLISDLGVDTDKLPKPLMHKIDMCSDGVESDSVSEQKKEEKVPEEDTSDEDTDLDRGHKVSIKIVDNNSSYA